MTEDKFCRLLHLADLKIRKVLSCADFEVAVDEILAEPEDRETTLNERERVCRKKYKKSRNGVCVS